MPHHNRATLLPAHSSSTCAFCQVRRLAWMHHTTHGGSGLGACDAWSAGLPALGRGPSSVVDVPSLLGAVLSSQAGAPSFLLGRVPSSMRASTASLALPDSSALGCMHARRNSVPTSAPTMTTGIEMRAVGKESPLSYIFVGVQQQAAAGWREEGEECRWAGGRGQAASAAAQGRHEQPLRALLRRGNCDVL